ncbi:hypothetical protein C8F04DRAFT_1393869 [Mycena alexandri]|uniref:Uncharacterized protein n=1 Tax=Mycena alexandri TaxID=1745969 RepID=A0AAD6T2B2_9AGAR|nr:hypothetical protein C8F04DRAFT_1393869 [Mycena alexandri]
MIPLGDIDLQRQIRVDEIRLDQNSRVISRQQHGCVWRVYSAKVEGRKSDMTVAVYKGETAEEEWRRDFAKYMTVRHPHILQVCGTATSGGIHATLFHGDLIPYNKKSPPLRSGRRQSRWSGKFRAPFLNSQAGLYIFVTHERYKTISEEGISSSEMH